jgi:hypothetical protein
MKNRRLLLSLGFLSAAISAAVVFACSGNDGANGTNGTNGSNGAAGAPGSTGTPGTNGTGTNGTNGANGEAGAQGPQGDAGGTVVISATAKHGLDISPVPLNTAGMTGNQLELVGQGSYLVNAIADCAGCHTGPAGFLGGGNVFGPVTSRNLTPDPTTGLKLTEDQFIQTIRTGQDLTQSPADGGTQALLVMPWPIFRWMSTHDLKAIYAYLKVIPPVSNADAQDTKPVFPPVPYIPTAYTDGVVPRLLPPENLNDAGNPTIPDLNNVLRGLAIVPLNLQPPAASSAGQVDLFGRGSYLVNAVAPCIDCHTNPSRNGPSVNTGIYLSGGAVFPTPPPLQPVLRTVRTMSENLTGPTQGFFNGTDQSIAPPQPVSFSTFLRLITEGVHADDPIPTATDGAVLGLQRPLGFPMPYAVFRNMALDDLSAIYTYVSAVAASGLVTSDKITQDPAVYCVGDTDCGPAPNYCNTLTHECVGRPCNVANNVGFTNTDCPVCQACGGLPDGAPNYCNAPNGDGGAACFLEGL